MPLLPPIRRKLRSFTLIELLTVMAIIAVLAGLVLGISGFANKKAALSRAEGELAAFASACENYKADNGGYPHQNTVINSGTSTIIPSDQLDPRTMGNSVYSGTGTTYSAASIELYQALTGDMTLSGTGGGPGVHNYLNSGLKQDVFGRSNASAAVSSSNTIEYLQDPFGNIYGYSTANSTTISTGSSPISGYTPPTTVPGYNPTFDLWSTAGQTANPYSPTGHPPAGDPGDPQLQWKKNW